MFFVSLPFCVILYMLKHSVSLYDQIFTKIIGCHAVWLWQLSHWLDKLATFKDNEIVFSLFFVYFFYILVV